jgi:hypothetical protein
LPRRQVEQWRLANGVWSQMRHRACRPVLRPVFPAEIPRLDALLSAHCLPEAFLFSFFFLPAHRLAFSISKSKNSFQKPDD